MELTNKERAIQLIKSLEMLDAAQVKFIDHQNFVEHDISSDEGIEGLIEALKTDDSGLRINIERVFQDGDYVILHSEYSADSTMIAFDVLRFLDGLAVEHWSNFQVKEVPNPSRRTMLDGAAEIKDIGQTESNKEIAKNIVDDILINGRMDRLAGYFNGDNYIQHNPWFADQVSGLVAALVAWAQQGISMTYSKTHMVLGEGNFALVISEGDLRGVHSSFYDLFRIEDGNIAEHWDTIEPMPKKNETVNRVGKFGFPEMNLQQTVR